MTVSTVVPAIPLSVALIEAVPVPEPVARPPVVIVATDVVSNASTVRCTLELSPDVPTGTWDVIVTDGVGRTATLRAALTIT